MKKILLAVLCSIVGIAMAQKTEPVDILQEEAIHETAIPIHESGKRIVEPKMPEEEELSILGIIAGHEGNINI